MDLPRIVTVGARLRRVTQQSSIRLSFHRRYRETRFTLSSEKKKKESRFDLMALISKTFGAKMHQDANDKQSL